MTDPYKILGVSPNASDEEIKIAYKELAKKYHSDNYVNNPLSDLAEEKMKEINVAYDEIMNMRRNGNTNKNYQNNRYGGGYSATSQFSDIRNLINRNRIVEAEELLNGVPTSNRDAEWYFLKGSVFYSRGWLDEAFKHFSTAVNMNPNNPEYRAALNNLMQQRNGSMNGYPNGGYRTNANVGGCSMCDMCQGLICADCCCECCGGDLISCC